MGNSRGDQGAPSDTGEREGVPTVLYVDSETGFREDVVDFLERNHGFAVEVEGSADAGKAALGGNAVDCVVSGYTLPEEDGISFLEEVRQNHPFLPFVLFTADGDEKLAREAISADVTEYVEKGAKAERFRVLGSRIEEAVSQYRDQLSLMESEERYRTVVENSHEGVYIYQGSEFVFVNERIPELTGYDIEELADVEIWSLLHPDDRTRVREIARKRGAPDEETPSTYTARIVRKDGEIRHCEFAVQSVTYQGEYAALGSVRDITERIERERRLERFETMVQVSGDPMYTLDETGEFTYVNDRLCEISGYERSELLGSHVSILLPEADVATGDAVIEELLSDPERDQATFEMAIQTAAGEQIEFENHIALLPFEEGSFQGTVGVVRDISDLKRRTRRLTALHEAANELERADTEEEVFTSLAEAARNILEYDFVSVDSVEGDYLVLRENVGVDSEEGLFHRVPLSAEDNLGATAVREGESSLVDDLRELEVTPADPEYRSALTVPIGEKGVFQAGAKTVGAFDAVDRELSELLVEHARTALVNLENQRRLREQQRELERENDRLEEFASVVSHDLRNPLTVASGRLAEAREQHDGEALAEVDRALDRMDQLIGDLLTLARQGKRVESKEPVEIQDLIQRCWGNVSTQKARLSVEVEEAVYADDSRLAQVFENLFRNSVEHGLPDEREASADDTEPPMTIRIGRLEDGFYVEDDGTGIPGDEREDVFATGYTTTENGTGFGLRIVEEVADAHGWDVHLTTGEMGGARFEFTGVKFASEESGD